MVVTARYSGSLLFQIHFEWSRTRRLTDNVHALSLTSHLPLSSLARCSALFPHPAAPGSLSRAAYPGPACMLFRAAYHTAARMLFQVPGYQEPDAAGGAHDGAHHVFDARCPSGGLSSRAGLRSDAVGVSTPKRRRSPRFSRSHVVQASSHGGVVPGAPAAMPTYTGVSRIFAVHGLCFHARRAHQRLQAARRPREPSANALAP